MSYVRLPYKEKPSVFKEHNEPPFSIPGVERLPNWEVHDNFLDQAQNKKIYDYLMNCPWHQYWIGTHSEMQLFKPNEWDASWIGPAARRPTCSQPRTMFGVDEASVKEKHPVIGELWDSINLKLDNQYTLDGEPEGMAWKDYPMPATQDPNIEQGWRCYANGSRHDELTLQGYVHRDTSDLSDENTVTMLYVATLEWYPSWGGELVFYPEDPTGATGDHQQFNDGPSQQRRNYNIGWQDEGALVCLRPNRLIIYDGRTLHSTQPTRNRNNTIMSIRVAFRARKVK